MTRFFEFFEPVIEIHQNLRGCAGYCVCARGVDDFSIFCPLCEASNFGVFSPTTMSDLDHAVSDALSMIRGTLENRF